MYERCKTEGLQATSRTQSAWPVRVVSCLYDCEAWSKLQILTALSLPPVTNRLNPLAPPDEETRLPGAVLGAHETELTPKPCAGKILWSMLLSLNSNTLTFPSELAHASRHPDSCGDHEMMFTEAVCWLYSNTRVHVEEEGPEVFEVASRQMKTVPS